MARMRKIAIIWTIMRIIAKSITATEVISMESGATLAFLEHCRAKNLSANTLRCYIQRLGYLAEYARAQEKTLGELTTTDITRYISQIVGRVSESTVNGRIIVYRVFYNYLKREGYVYNNPANQVPFIREPKRIKSIIYPDQLELALKHMKPNFSGVRDKLIIVMAYDCCLRINEILSLTLRDIQFSPQRRLRVIGKGNKEREVSFSSNLSQKLLYYLDKYRPGIPGDLLFPTASGTKLDPTNAYRSLRRICDKVGFKANLHLLRHSGATLLYRRLKNLDLVRAVLGHESITTTQIYLHTAAEDIVQAYEDYSPASGINF